MLPVNFDLFRPLKSFLFDYASGLAWLMALAALRLAKWLSVLEPGEQWFCRVGPVWKTPGLVDLIDHSHSLQFAISAACIAVAIVLPYATSVALQPVSIFAVNAVLLIDRKTQRVRNLYRRFSPGTAEISHTELRQLEHHALSRLNEHLKYFRSGCSTAADVAPERKSAPFYCNHIIDDHAACAFAEAPRPMHLTNKDSSLAFLEKHSAPIAQWLDRGYDEIWLDYSLTVPTGILCGAVLCALFDADCVWCMLVGSTVFYISALRAIRKWRSWQIKLNTSLILALSEREAASMADTGRYW